MADIFYTDVPPVTDSPPYRVPYTPAAPRRLRNWHKFVATYGLILTGIALLLREVVLRTGGNEAGGVAIVAGVALVGLLAGLVILYIAWRIDRL